MPLVIPLAWTWMAWPALAGRRPAHWPTRPVARGSDRARRRLGLAAWDLFLDPQMVAAGHWRWADPTPALPGVAGVPAQQLPRLAARRAALMAAVLRPAAAGQPEPPDRPDDVPMLALYLWTYASSVLAHAVFLDLPASALWGAVGMGAVAVPLLGRWPAGGAGDERRPRWPPATCAGRHRLGAACADRAHRSSTPRLLRRPDRHARPRSPNAVVGAAAAARRGGPGQALPGALLAQRGVPT